jgi:hypothetical protein
MVLADGAIQRHAVGYLALPAITSSAPVLPVTSHAGLYVQVISSLAEQSQPATVS